MSHTASENERIRRRQSRQRKLAQSVLEEVCYPSLETVLPMLHFEASIPRLLGRKHPEQLVTYDNSIHEMLAYLSRAVEEIIFKISHETLVAIRQQSRFRSLVCASEIRFHCPSSTICPRYRISVIRPN
jgi:hypothetical protein